MTDTVEQQVERRVFETHRETIVDVCTVGNAVAASWPGQTVSEAREVTEPLADRLDAESLPERLLDTLDTAVDATGRQTTANPVPAPPYFVVTSRGPTCRATLDDGQRLVLLFELFGVERRPRTYQFRDPSPATCPTVRLRSTDEIGTK